MDTISHLDMALLAFYDNHPVLAAFILIVYASVVLGLFLFLCISLHDLRTIPWLPPIFLTDGILVCCCPLAAVLPIILWPLMVVYHILMAAYYILLGCLKWFLAAPTFCGIRREALVQLYQACAEGLRRRKRDKQDMKQMKQKRPLLWETNPFSRHQPQTGYGTLNNSGTWVTRGQYSNPFRRQGMQYDTQSPFQNKPPLMSAPSPFQQSIAKPEGNNQSRSSASNMHIRGRRPMGGRVWVPKVTGSPA